MPSHLTSDAIKDQLDTSSLYYSYGGAASDTPKPLVKCTHYISLFNKVKHFKTY